MAGPVVFVHGLLGTLDDAEMLRACSPDPADTFAPDLAGYGEFRDADSAGVALPAQVAHLARLVAARYGRQPVHLVGHSIGGAIALLFADAHPERVASVVDVEGNFTLKDAFWSAAIARMTAAEVAAMLEGFCQAPADWLASAGVQPTPRTVAIARGWFDRQPADTVRALAGSVVAITAGPEYLALARRVFTRTPVHLVTGERSVAAWDIPPWAYPEQHARRESAAERSAHQNPGRESGAKPLANCNPGRESGTEPPVPAQHSRCGSGDVADAASPSAASLTILPGRGHIMMLEAPGEFGALVRRLTRGA